MLFNGQLKFIKHSCLELLVVCSKLNRYVLVLQPLPDRCYAALLCLHQETGETSKDSMVFSHMDIQDL